MLHFLTASVEGEAVDLIFCVHAHAEQGWLCSQKNPWKFVPVLNRVSSASNTGPALKLSKSTLMLMFSNGHEPSHQCEPRVIFIPCLHIPMHTLLSDHWYCPHIYIPRLRNFHLFTFLGIHAQMPVINLALERLTHM